MAGGLCGKIKIRKENKWEQKGMEKGIQKGALKQAKETAWNLHRLGMDDDMIAKMVNVNVSLVREWLLESKQ